MSEAGDLGPGRRLFWGAAGGMLPIAARLLLSLLAQGTDAPLPHFGGGFLLAVGLAVVLGAIAGLVFKAHGEFVAIYHGASAPTVFAFLGAEALKPH